MPGPQKPTADAFDIILAVIFHFYPTVFVEILKKFCSLCYDEPLFFTSYFLPNSTLSLLDHFFSTSATRQNVPKSLDVLVFLLKGLTVF